METTTTERERTLVEKFQDAKREHSRLKALTDEAHERLAQVEKDLMDLLEAEGKKSSARYDGLGHVTLVKPRLYASVIKEKEAELFDFLRKTNRDHLIKEIVHSASLSALVSELIEQGEENPPGTTYYLEKRLLFTPLKG